VAGLLRRLFGGAAPLDSAGDGAPTATDQDRGRGWRDLSPTPSAVPAAPLTVQTLAFENGLTTRRNPLFLEPLGHYVSGDGPNGTVEGIAEVVSPVVQTFAPRPPSVEVLRSASAAAPSGQDLDLGGGSGVSEPPSAGSVSATLSPPVLQRSESADAGRADVAGLASLIRAPDPAPLPLVLDAVHPAPPPAPGYPVQRESSDPPMVDQSVHQPAPGRPVDADEAPTLAPAPAPRLRVSRITEVNESRQPSPPLRVGPLPIKTPADESPTITPAERPSDFGSSEADEPASVVPIQRSPMVRAEGPIDRLDAEAAVATSAVGPLPALNAPTRPVPRLGLGAPIRQVRQPPPAADPLAPVQRQGDSGVDRPLVTRAEPLIIQPASASAPDAPPPPVPAPTVSQAPAPLASAAGPEANEPDVAEPVNDVGLLGSSSSSVVPTIQPLSLEDGPAEPSPTDRHTDPLPLTVQSMRTDTGDASAPVARADEAAYPISLGEDRPVDIHPIVSTLAPGGSVTPLQRSAADPIDAAPVLAQGAARFPSNAAGGEVLGDRSGTESRPVVGQRQVAGTQQEAVVGPLVDSLPLGLSRSPEPLAIDTSNPVTPVLGAPTFESVPSEPGPGEPRGLPQAPLMSSRPLAPMSSTAPSAANPVISRRFDDGGVRRSAEAESAVAVLAPPASAEAGPAWPPAFEPAWTVPAPIGWAPQSGSSSAPFARSPQARPMEAAPSGWSAVAQRQLGPQPATGTTREVQRLPVGPASRPSSLAPPDLPLARPAPAPAPVPPVPVVAQIPVQRAEDPPAPSPAPAPAAAPSGGGESPPPASAPPGAGGGQNLDELSRQLYDRIRDRLRAELRLDRERAGMVSDRIG
jgi:hypothetical protein